MPDNDHKTSALPEPWIVPIKLFIYVVLAACSIYVYLNAGELRLTHYLIIVSIVSVAAMVLLDCRMSTDYWQKQATSGKDGNNSGAKSNPGR